MTGGASNELAVRLSDVHLHYEVLAKRNERFAEHVMSGFPRKTVHHVRALEGITFDLVRGDALGVVGHNGAGKSTLLQVIAGLLQPSKGTVLVSDQPQLLGVQAALNPRITGRLNIELGCRALGMGTADIEEVTPGIIDFADLAEFIDLPVNTYSTGMRARLGFAISTVSRPEILLIDEALAVGDKDFRARSVERLHALRGDAGVVVLVSHGLGAIANSCNKVLWLHEGTMHRFGGTTEVIDEYRESTSPVNRKVQAKSDPTRGAKDG